MNVFAPLLGLSGRLPLTICSLLTVCSLQSISAFAEEVNPAHGIDANRNGVRDDVDAKISAQYAERKQISAASRLAAAFQQSIVTDKSDANQVTTALEQNLVAMACIDAAFGDDAREAVQFVTTSVVNTPPRKNAFTAYSRALRQIVSQEELLRRTSPGIAPACPD